MKKIRQRDLIIFVYLLPQDFLKIFKFHSKGIGLYPWIEREDHYFESLGNKSYLLYDGKSEEGIFRFASGPTRQKQNLAIFNPLNKQELAQKISKDKNIFIKTQDLGTIWNYPVQGFLINPYSFLLKKELPLPNGKLFKLDGPHPQGAARWLEYLKEKWQDYTHFDREKDLKFIFKSLLEVAKMNLNMRIGIVDEPVKSNLPSRHAKKSPGVIGKDKEQNRTITLQKKAELVKQGECPYGEACEYKKRGLLCFHNKNFEKLATFFKTRDIDLILEGFAKLIQSESGRYEKGVALEEAKSTLDPLVTAIGQGLFQKLVEYVKLVKPELQPQTTYNILNQQVNIGVAVQKLEEAGLSERQRQDLAREVTAIIEDEKSRRIGGVPMASAES